MQPVREDRESMNRTGSPRLAIGASLVIGSYVATVASGAERDPYEATALIIDFPPFEES